MRRRTYSVMLAVSLLLACSSSPKGIVLPRQGLIGNNPNCFHIVNGQKTTAHPEVTMIIGLDNAGKISGHCTGTFIAKNVVATAAHCIDGNAPIGISRATEIAADGTNDQAVLSTFVRASKVLNMDPTINSRTWSSVDAKADAAILIFNNDVAPAIAPLMDRQPVNGDNATLVGFGMDDVDPRYATLVDAKRYGYNTVRLESYGLSLVGTSYNTGTYLNKNSTTASGDSGGPLFIDGKLAGILSGGGPYQSSTTLDKSDYANTFSSAVKAFIQQGLEEGKSVLPTVNSEPDTVLDPISTPSDC